MVCITCFVNSRRAALTASIVSEMTLGRAPAATQRLAILSVLAVVLLNLKNPQSVAIAI